MKMRGRSYSLLGLLAVPLLLAGVGAVSNDRLLTETERLRVQDREELAANVSARLDNGFAKAAALFQAQLAQLPLTLTPGSPQDAALLAKVTSPSGMLAVRALDGSPLAATPGKVAPPAADDPVYASLVEQVAKNGTGGAIARSGEANLIGYAFPVLRNGTPVAMGIFFAYLDGETGAVQINVPTTSKGGGKLYVISRDRQIVAAPDPTRIGSTVPDSPGWRDLAAGRQSHVTLVENGTRWVAVASSNPTSPLVPVFVQDAAGFYGSTRQDHQRSNLALLGILAVVAVSLAVLNHRRQRATAASEQRLAALLHNAGDAVLLVRHGRVDFAGPATERVFADAFGNGVGRSLGELVLPDGTNLVAELCGLAEESPGTTVTKERVFTTLDGEHHWLWITAVDLHTDKAINGTVLTCRDITEAKELHERVAHQALHDSLTGLPNRALFATRLDLAVKRRRRSLSNVGVLFLDLDRFKPVNDRLGHEAGDRLLREIGLRLKNAVRETDTVARMGGDEFAVVAEEAGSEHELLELARRLSAAVEEPITLGDDVVEVGVSIGIATVHDADQPDDVLRRADLAMYTAKDAPGEGIKVAGAYPSL